MENAICTENSCNQGIVERKERSNQGERSDSET